MRKINEENLKSAFAGKSQAHMKYLIFAKKAEDEDFSNIVRLFKAIAYVEQIYTTNHYNELGMIRSISENLQVAIDGELYEVNEMYPAYNIMAKIQDEKGVEKTTNWALQAEKIHASLYQRVKQAVNEEKNIKTSPIYTSLIYCGYTTEDKL